LKQFKFIPITLPKIFPVTFGNGIGFSLAPSKSNLITGENKIINKQKIQFKTNPKLKQSIGKSKENNKPSSIFLIVTDISATFLSTENS
jgi:hypothetical protein